MPEAQAVDTAEPQPEPQPEPKSKVNKYADEGKDEKFRRLARGRAEQAIRKIRGIKVLANKGHYEWTDQQITTLIRALRKEVDDLEGAFNRKNRSDIHLAL